MKSLARLWPRGLPRDADNLFDLEEWRGWFGDVLNLLFVVLLPLSIFISARVLLAQGHHLLVALDVVLWLTLLTRYLFFRSVVRPSHKLLWLAILYVMTLSFFVGLGPNYARAAWLMFGAVLAALLYGAWGGAAASLGNGAALVALYLLLDPQNPAWAETYRLGALPWTMFVVNSSLLALGASLPVGFLIGRLDRALTNEQQAHQRLQAEVAERVQAERTLSEHQARLDKLTADLPQVVLFQFREPPAGPGRFTLVSGNVAALSEVTPVAVLQDPEAIFGQLRPADRQKLEARHLAARRSLTTLRLEVQCLLPSGARRWYEVVSTPRTEPDGGVLWDGVWLDINERKRFEEDLVKSEERYRLVVDHAQEGIVITQLTRISFCNRRLAEMAGCSAEELLATPLEDLLHPDERGFLTQQMLQRYRGLSLPSRFRLRVVPKTGGVVWLDCHSALVTWEGAPAILSFVTDISELVQAEERHRRYEAEMRQAQKMEAVGTLAGGIAHDFNNILTAVMGYTELLQLRLAQLPEDAGYLAQVMAGCERARELIRQILTFSHQAQPEPRPVQVRDPVAEALRLLRASLPATVDIRADLASQAQVLGDATSIHQVLMNLGANAGQALGERDGILWVGLYDLNLDEAAAGDHADLAPGPYVRLVVSDNGRGMSPEVRERIFDPFFTTRKRGEGTGLGLAVTHGIIKGMGGEIQVQSQPGQGTIFDILLPALDTPAPGEAAAAAPLYRGHGRVLVVDDEEAVRQVLGRMLEMLGFTVVTAFDGAAALARLEREPGDFDLVVTDLIMPRLTGDALAQEIAARGLHLPVILATGQGRGFAQEELAALGIQAQLHKPISLRKLSETLAAVLGEKGEG
ncbi:MAG: PAS domain S-box protein [Deltaproteobacteria bacterium]|nr:PAS domain S-box protein [Deltaproteobacteria bacterium]